MDTAKRKAALDDIERLVDAFSVHDVLELLAEVCEMKAAHIRENWQDRQSARVWDWVARRVEKLSLNVWEV